MSLKRNNDEGATKIVIAGGSGFIGRYLTNRFEQEGAEVLWVGRRAKRPGDITWDDKGGLYRALNQAALLINLAGKSVNCRYNQPNREEILSSRIETTRKLGETLQQCENPPALWINSSTATIYRHAKDRPQTEKDGEIGSGFSVDVATAWEDAFFSFDTPETRQVALRTAIVLGKDGGALQPMIHMTKLGLGGKQGSGKQKFSWIHIDDLFGIIAFIMKNPGVTGVVNCSSPYPVSNKELMKLLRKELRVAAGLPAPKWLLKIGAALIGTETELILKSRWVLPEKLLSAGYEFQFTRIGQALEDILHKP